MANTFDIIMEWGIPILLIAVAVGFVYVKFIKPWFLPFLQDAWAWIQGRNKEPKQGPKEITYE